MNARRRLLTNSLLTVLLLVVVAVCANYLSMHSFFRLDLTEDGDFTLSPAARTLVRGLESPVSIEVFMSEDLPPQFAQHTQALQDKLAEFQAVAEVPFEVIYTDPGDDEASTERARRLGVTPRETSARSRSKVESQITWLGLSIHYRDGQEALPFVDSIAMLEYEVARALRSLQTGGKKKVVAFVTGAGEPDLAAALEDQRNPLRQLAQVLADNYELRSVPLLSGAEVGADVDVLLVMGSQQQPSDAVQYAVDQFLMRGGAVGLFPLAAVPNVQTRAVEPAPANWSRLLSTWGVELSQELIVDRRLNGAIRLPTTVRTRRGSMQISQQVNSPLVPVMRDLNRDHPVTRRVDTVVAPFALAVDSAGAEDDPALEAVVLVRSSPAATVGLKVVSLDPATVGEPGEDEVLGPHAALVAVRGAFKSAWAGKPAPALDGGVSGAPVEVAPEGTRLLVGGSFEMPIANPGLMLSAIDWMASDETLLGIRPRMGAPPLLDLPEGGSPELLAKLNVLGMPLLVMLFGVVRLRARSRRGGAR